MTSSETRSVPERAGKLSAMAASGTDPLAARRTPDASELE
jgi:hypothetical protein